MQFGAHRAYGLCREQVDITHAEYREYGNRKKDYSQTSYPMSHGAPEEERLWKRVNIGKYRGTRSGEASL